MLNTKEADICLTLIAVSKKMRSPYNKNDVKVDFDFYKAYIPNFYKNYQKITKNKKLNDSEKNVVMKQIVAQWTVDNLKKYPRCRTILHHY